MHTIRLNINDKIYEKLLWLLSKFNKDELEIIPEDADFTETREYLSSELKEMAEGKAKFIEFNEVAKRLEKIIKSHEDNI